MGAGVHKYGNFVLVADVVDVCCLSALLLLVLREESEVECEMRVGSLFDCDDSEEEVEVGLLGDIVGAEGELEFCVGGLRGKKDGAEL
jgi:hypothetical protein